MNVLDLFSGIGGFSIGFERAGWTTVAFCEIEPYPRAVLKKHWPKVPCYDDVRTLTAARLRADGVAAVDVVCGGFPCQDISIAGPGAGLAGARSGLWSEIARLVGELRPRYVVVENVSALRGRGLGTVLGDLAALGYDAEWHCIPAAAVGAPHLRDRIWIVAYPNADQDGCDHDRRKLPNMHLREPESRRVAGELHRDVPNADNERPPQRRLRAPAETARVGWHDGGTRGGTDTGEVSVRGAGEGAEDVADADGRRELQPQGGEREVRERIGNGGAALADANLNGREGFGVFGERARAGGCIVTRGAIARAARANRGPGGWWASESGLGRVADGIPNRPYRLAALGNAVVPEIPYIIAQEINDYETKRRIA